MKIKVISMVLAASVVIFSSATQAVQAQAQPSQITVEGIVSHEGQSREGVEVWAQCGQAGHYEGERGHALTKEDGSYSINLSATDTICEQGELVQVYASTNDDSANKTSANKASAVKGGGLSGWASKIISGIKIKINISISITIGVPEYGFIGSLMATAAGVGAIAFVRRRYSSQSARL